MTRSSILCLFTVVLIALSVSALHPLPNHRYLQPTKKTPTSTTAAAAAATMKITNFTFNTICPPTESHSNYDSVSLFTATISPVSTDVQYTRAAIVFDSTAVQTTSPPSADVDNQTRLQCKVNGSLLTSKWTTHQQIVTIDNVKRLGIHSFIDVPENIIQKNAKSFTPFNITCNVFTNDKDSISTGFLSVVDINTVTPKDYIFACGLYGVQQGPNCVDFSSKPQKQQQHQQQHISPHHTSPFSSSINSLPFLSLTRELFPEDKSVVEMMTNNVNGAQYVLSDVALGNLQADGDFWKGNVTFTVNVTKQPAANTRTALAVALSKTIIADNDIRFKCLYQHMTPFKFNERYGLYWIASLPISSKPSSFSIYCDFYSRYSSTQLYFSINEIPLEQTVCKDPFECDPAHPHSGQPNPDGTCIHGSYR